MKTAYVFLIAVLMNALPAASPVRAADLKTHVIADDPLLTLGDLFEDAGEAAHVVVARAPAPGGRQMLSVSRIFEMARKHGLTIPPGIDRISIERPGRALGLEEITDLVAEKLSGYGADANGRIELSGRYSKLFMPLQSVDLPELRNFTFEPRSRRFSGSIDIKDIDGRVKSARLAGRVVAVVSVPVLRRIVRPGDVISAQDIGWTEIPARRVSQNLALSREQIVGMSPRRVIRPGVAIRTTDIRRPIAVAKGALVTMSIRRTYMQLTASGRALDDGSLGDVIRVVNPKSHITVHGVVVGPNQVRIDSGAVPIGRRLSSLR